MTLAAAPNKTFYQQPTDEKKGRQLGRDRDQDQDEKKPTNRATKQSQTTHCWLRVAHPDTVRNTDSIINSVHVGDFFSLFLTPQKQ